VYLVRQARFTLEGSGLWFDPIANCVPPWSFQGLFTHQVVLYCFPTYLHNVPCAYRDHSTYRTVDEKRAEGKNWKLRPHFWRLATFNVHDYRLLYYWKIGKRLLLIIDSKLLSIINRLKYISHNFYFSGKASQSQMLLLKYTLIEKQKR
jgi:hypothetical protein